MPEETVTIACRLPNGIHLDVFDMEDYDEKTILGTVVVRKRAVKNGRFTVKGIGRRTDDSGLSMGFALTHGCPKRLWDKWLAANKENPAVTTGVIFAAGNSSDARAKGRENEAVRTGLEPVDPKNLPREFKGKIETAERPAA